MIAELDYMLFFFQAEDGIRDHCVTGVQTCALPILTAKYSKTATPENFRELIIGCLKVRNAFTEDQGAVNEANKLEARKDRKSTRLNSSHTVISYAVFCLKKKKKKLTTTYGVLKIRK